MQSVQLDLNWVVVMGDKIAFQMVVEFVGGKNKNSKVKITLVLVLFQNLSQDLSVLFR